MTTRPRSRPLISKCVLIARDAARRGRLRLVAGLTVAVTLAGTASLGFALNQAAPEEPVGLQGAWPDFPPASLSFEAFARLDGKWAKWSEAAAVDVGEFYALADKDLARQQQALEKIRRRIRVLERALKDPAYSMIREELTSVYVPLKLRANLFDRSLDLLAADAAAAAGPARQTAAVDLRNALSSLESDLRSIPKGEAWLPYVAADEVRRSIDTPAAIDVLAPLPEKLDPYVEGRTPEQAAFLKRPSLLRYRSAVVDFLAISQVAESGSDKALLRERLAALVEAIDLHEASPTGEASRAIRHARTALRHAAGPVSAPIDELIRRNYLNYNLRLVADAPFLSKLVATTDINCGPVRDQFMGANIYGNQQTNTSADLVFIPSNDAAKFNLTLAGNTNSQTTAYTSQATVQSVGQHQFYAVKPITFNGDLFELGPADLSINPRIRHVGISTKYDNIFFGLFKGMIQRRAFSEANSRLPAGRAHAADELRQSFLPEFNGKVDQQFGEMNAELAAFESRMRKQGVAPQAERTRTTSDRFLLDAAVRDGGEVSGSPPNIGSTRGVGFTLQVHESLLNNAADRWGFAGRRMTDQQVEAELKKWFSDLMGRPVEFGSKDESDGREPTTLIFNETDPVRFRIANGAVVLILRAGIEQENGEDIPPQLVEVPLNLSVRDGQVAIERGTVKVSPVDRPRSRATQIARAGAMRRKIEDSIEDGTRDGSFLIEREGRSPVAVQIHRIDAGGGWLTIYGT
ncbi:MAG: hypothetical protein WBC44_12045 [Planctomycetaceae bacterium]